MNVFEEIYRKNGWNGRESRSGPGSGTESTAKLAAFLPEFCQDAELESVLDVGCGDGFWMPNLPGYVGVDVSPYAIGAAESRHPGRDYRVLDAVREELPRGFDLVIVRDVIQHLPLADGKALVENARASGRLLLCSTYINGRNRDIAPGECYTPDMQADPFNLGPWLEIEPDGWGWADRTWEQDATKRLALWGTWE